MGDEIAIATMGPVPPQLVAEVITQCAKQGWNYLDSLMTGGAARMKATIQTPGQPDFMDVPLYIVLVTKEIIPGEEVDPPKVQIGGKSMG